MFVSTFGRTRVSGVNQRATRQEFRIGRIRFIAACIVDSFIFKIAASLSSSLPLNTTKVSNLYATISDLPFIQDQQHNQMIFPGQFRALATATVLRNVWFQGTIVPKADSRRDMCKLPEIICGFIFSWCKPLVAGFPST